MKRATRWSGKRYLYGFRGLGKGLFLLAGVGFVLSWVGKEADWEADWLVNPVLLADIFMFLSFCGGLLREHFDSRIRYEEKYNDEREDYD